LNFSIIKEKLYSSSWLLAKKQGSISLIMILQSGYLKMEKDLDFRKEIMIQKLWFQFIEVL
jgi:hypothetical protein